MRTVRQRPNLGLSTRAPYGDVSLSRGPDLPFSFARFFLFAVLGLPLGFILVALVFAVMGLSISAPQVFPWAVGIAGIAGVIGGVSRAKPPAG